MVKHTTRSFNTKRFVFLILVLITLLGVFIFYLATRPSPLCNRLIEGKPNSGISARVLTDFEGDDRCYLIYIPHSHDPAQPATVIMTLHGYLSNPEGIMMIDGWRKIA